jgi:transposase InsO family protein
MPFRESCAMEERIAMLREFDAGVFSAAELASRYGISRETFYVWKRRRESGDPAWFVDRPSAPGCCPHRTEAAIAEAVIAMRRRFPRFGPKKVRAKLRESDRSVAWPAASTMGEILKRSGLVDGVSRRRPAVSQGEVTAGGTRPNEEWSIDFKGWFRTLDGRRVDPLTVVDTASRYLLTIRIVPPTYDGARGELERLFGEIGLPAAIRSDNGSPFGADSAGGLSRLSAWLLRLGIDVRFIPPGSPQDNGRHERMHRELKAATALDPSANAAAQQARFDAFRAHYNVERPHEALDQTPPARHWVAPALRLPDELPPPWYDADHEVRRVRPTGEIKWRGGMVFVSTALVGETIGLREVETGGHLARFCRRDLGVIGLDGCFRRFAPPRARVRRREPAET